MAVQYTVVAGGWLEAPPRKTKMVKLLLEELGWLSRTALIESSNRPGHPDHPEGADDPDATAGIPGGGKAARLVTKLLPLTDVGTAALLAWSNPSTNRKVDTPMIIRI